MNPRSSLPRPKADSNVTEVATVKLYEISFPLFVLASSPEKALEFARDASSRDLLEAPELRELGPERATCDAIVHGGVPHLDSVALTVIDAVFPDGDEDITVAKAFDAGFAEGLIVLLSKPTRGKP